MLGQWDLEISGSRDKGGRCSSYFSGVNSPLTLPVVVIRSDHGLFQSIVDQEQIEAKQDACYLTPFPFFLSFQEILKLSCAEFQGFAFLP